MHSARFEVVDPDDVKVRLEVCANIKTWRKVENALHSKNRDYFDVSVSEILDAVRDAISMVEKEFIAVRSADSD